MQHDPDVVAGSLHNSLLNASRDTVHGFDVLPGLMRSMLERDAWRKLIRPADGKLFTHDDIESWILGEPWGGLHFPSWDALYAMLERAENGRPVIAMLKAKGAPEDGFREDVQREKSKGKSLRQVAREKGENREKVRRAASDTGRVTENRIRLSADPAKTAQSIIAARGLAYARELATAIAQWEAQ
jgi:hypothetical protein